MSGFFEKMIEMDTKIRKLNLGCGQNKLENCVNIDCEKSVNPDIVTDFRNKLPFEDCSFDEIYLMHTIEHVEKRYHEQIFREVHRVLVPEGFVFISYPEFIKCATNYITNKNGMRDFWEATIYGRQLYKSDYHVALMDSNNLTALLKRIGFHKIELNSEPVDDFNTFLIARKGIIPINYDDLIKEEVWGKPVNA